MSDRVMQPQKPGILEQIFTVITLVLYTNGPFNVILSGGASQGDMVTSQTDYTLTRNIYMLIYLISAALVAVRWRRALYLLTKGKFIILLFLLALASNFWSTVPEVTHSRSIALVGTLLFALYFASRYTIRQQLRILGITCGVILGMSLLFI
ncbi:MAG TPA: hypothetical protein V6C65_04955, partial [Allocoleopsis sp.]